MGATRIAISVAPGHEGRLEALLHNHELLAKYGLSGLVLVDDDEPAPEIMQHTWWRSMVKRVTAMWRNRKGKQSQLPPVAPFEAPPAHRALESLSSIADPEQRDEFVSWTCMKARLTTRDVDAAVSLPWTAGDAREIDDQDLVAAVDEAWLTYQQRKQDSVDWPRREKKQHRARLRYGLHQSCVGAKLVAASSAPGPWSEMMHVVGVAALREGSRVLGTLSLCEPTESDRRRPW